MLAPLGRCCWKQARLGKGALDVQQKGIAGNTILFAEPTAEIPSMELSPAHDALVESLNVGFSGKAHDLSKAHWATVKRAEYMQHDLRQGVALGPRPHQVHALAEDVGGRMAVKIVCGDFYQLPPVSPSASLLAPHTGQSYEHQQGRLPWQLRQRRVLAEQETRV